MYKTVEHHASPQRTGVMFILSLDKPDGSVVLAVLGVACNMLAYFCVAAMIRLLLSGGGLEGCLPWCGLLLDEDTASLDAETETEIQQAISRLVERKTVLIIAYRMRTVESASKIVVLSDGTVSKMGTPAELMKKNGAFARMVKLQTESQNWTLA